MNIVSVVGCKLGSSSQSSGSRSDICCRFPILSSLLPAVTCSKDQFRSDISYRYLILSSLLPAITYRYLILSSLLPAVTWSKN